MSKVVKAVTGIFKPKIKTPAPVSQPTPQPSNENETIAPQTDADLQDAGQAAADAEKERLRLAAGRQSTILTGGSDPGFDAEAQKRKRKTLLGG